MRKLFTFAGLMMAAIVSLTNCQPKELVPQTPADGIKIVMSLDDTKTTNDGMSTLWAEKDKVGVFFRDVTGGFTSLGAFNLTSGAGMKSGTFEPASTDTEGFKKLDQNEAYDWFVLYPYNSNVTTPASVDADGGFMYVGRKTGLNQAGYDSSAAISGDNCPMYVALQGKKISDLSGNVSVKHLTSLVEFTLVNNTGKNIVISALTMTASEAVVGDFFIDVTGNSPYFTPRDTEHALKAATVNIQDAGTIAPGGTAKVYLPIKPYYQSGKEEFKVSLTGTIDGKAAAREFTSIPDQGKSYFEAGKVKKITLKIDGMTLTEGCTVADVLAGDVGADYSLSEVQVTSVVGSSYFVTDATGTIMCYKSGHGLAVGDIVNVSGKTKAYNNLVEFDNPAATKVSSGSCSLNPVAWSMDDMVAAYGNAQIAYVSFEGTFSGSRNCPLYNDIVLYTTNASGVSISKDKTYRVTGYVYGWTDFEKDSNVTKEVCMYVEKAEEVGAEQTATLEISPKSMTFEAAGGSKDLTVTCDNDNWTWSGAPLWVSVTREGDKVTIGVAENTGEEKREGTVTFTHSNGTLSAELKISQKGTAAADAISLSPASYTFDAVPSGPLEVTVTSNADGWTFDDPTETWIHLSVSGNTVTVTVDENTGEARNVTVKFHHANGTPNANLVINQRAKSSGNKVTYTKVTSGTIGTGDYLIVCEDAGKALDGSLTDYSKANSMSVTISGNTITIDEGSDIHYDATAKTIQSASGLYIGAKSNNNNGISTRKSDPAGSSAIYVIDITVSNGEASIGCSLDAGLHSLKYNNTSGSDFFRFYKPSSTLESSPLSIYKKN